MVTALAPLFLLAWLAQDRPDTGARLKAPAVPDETPPQELPAPKYGPPVPPPYAPPAPGLSDAPPGEAPVAEPPPVDFPPPRAAPPEPPLPPPPPPAPRAQRYGDAGTSEVSLAFGYDHETGFLADAGYRHCLVTGVAPGIEASVQTGGSGYTVGLLLASLRLVPVRENAFALVVTGRTGRVLLSSHPDGWGAGGGAGVIFFLSPNVGVEVSYEILWLLPRGFCADLTSCTIQGPDIGLRVAF